MGSSKNKMIIKLFPNRTKPKQTISSELGVLIKSRPEVNALSLVWVGTLTSKFG